MTVQQKAHALLSQLPEDALPQVIQYLSTLLRNENDVAASRKDGEALFRELMELREKTLKYHLPNFETACNEAFGEKSPQQH